MNGVLLTELRRISHPQGDILHGMKACDPGFTGFGEAYFSTVHRTRIKGWKRHNRMTLNLIVIAGSIEFVIHDDREDSPSQGEFQSVQLSLDNYQRLTISPGLWVAFRGLSDALNIVANIANLEHDPREATTVELKDFSYNWGHSQAGHSR